MSAFSGPGPPSYKHHHVDERIKLVVDLTSNSHQADLSAYDVGYSDLLQMETFDEEAYIDNLRYRYIHDQIYTYLGQILISINPYKKLSIYSNEILRKYKEHSRFTLPPHIYAIANESIQMVINQNHNVCLVLSGESGSGKSETFKLLTQYISSMNYSTSVMCCQGRDSSVLNAPKRELSRRKNQLVYLNVLLEAFGNAKTLRNDNSTRFSKLIEIDFNFSNEINGIYITCFLLDADRIARQMAGERNFHIFYQLIGGADIQLLKNLRLQRNYENFSILCRQDVSQPLSIDDKQDFTFTKKTMEFFGLLSTECQGVFDVLACLLKLGNITYSSKCNIDGTHSCHINNESELEDLAFLLQTDTNNLLTCLTCRSVCCDDDDREIVFAEMSTQEATCLRDQMCRSIYSRLFNWLLQKINSFFRAQCHVPRRHKLSMLDTPGFELYSCNGLEQFVVNYTSEKIHQLFVRTELRETQELFVHEGISWQPVDYCDNHELCNFVEWSQGLLTVIQEGCTNLSQRFAEAASISQVPLDFSPADALQTDESYFRIIHFAGNVKYMTREFECKNRNSLPNNVCNILFECRMPLIKLLFAEVSNCKKSALKRPTTDVATQLRVTLISLLQSLAKHTVRYVCCLQPNNSRQSQQFDVNLVRYQFKYHNLIECVKIKNNGFLYNERYERFFQRYKMLSNVTWPCWHGLVVEGVTYLLQDLPIMPYEYKFGCNRIFIRSLETIDHLEAFRRESLGDLACLIQKIWRGWRQYNRFCLMKRAQVVIAVNWRMWKAQKELRFVKRKRHVECAARKILHFYCTRVRRRFLLELRDLLPSESPVCDYWPCSPVICAGTSCLLYRLYHKWRCLRYRRKFDQTSRNRMREKVTASLLFKGRKTLYLRSINHPFLGDYVRLRQNSQWRRMAVVSEDYYVVFSDIINKIARSSGKFVPVLFVLSTNSMLIVDQRTLTVKYRVPVTDIKRVSLSPYMDDIAVFHVSMRSASPHIQKKADTGKSSGCLSLTPDKPEACKGDFVFQTGHIIEIVTKLYLVVQNANSSALNININTEFDANFGHNNVTFIFKSVSQAEKFPGKIRILRRANRMEVII